MMLVEREGEVYYITDDGAEYYLNEVMSMGGEMRTDLVVVFKEDENGFPVFVTWFAGAEFYYTDRDEFLNICKTMIEGVEIHG